MVVCHLGYLFHAIVVFSCRLNSRAQSRLGPYTHDVKLSCSNVKKISYRSFVVGIILFASEWYRIVGSASMCGPLVLVFKSYGGLVIINDLPVSNTDTMTVGGNRVLPSGHRYVW